MKNFFIFMLLAGMVGLGSLYISVQTDLELEKANNVELSGQVKLLRFEKERLAKTISEYNEAIQKQEEAIKTREKQIEEISQNALLELERAKTQKEYVYVEVDKIVERPVYKNICIDQEGLDVLNSLIP